jgi:hypothetical protein
MTLTCAIIDDEPLAVKLLAAYVQKTPALDLVSTYSSAVEAILGLEEAPVDLIFCDIQMPELDGLQFAQIISTTHSRIIFTTAYDKYAVEGWKVDALDYLLKPIGYEEFLAAVQKAMKWFAHETQPLPSAIESFFIKSDYKLIRVHFDEILYIEGLRDYVKIYLTGARKPILSLTSMRTIEAALPADWFMRTHRSFIVNLHHIEIIERGQIIFGEKYIPVSDSYKDAVQNYVYSRLLQSKNDK